MNKKDGADLGNVVESGDGRVGVPAVQHAVSGRLRDEGERADKEDLIGWTEMNSPSVQD